jgi:hypothetical protein
MDSIIQSITKIRKRLKWTKRVLAEKANNWRGKKTMKKLVLALALMIFCCFGSTYLYAEENQPTKKITPTKKIASRIVSIGGGVFFPQSDLYYSDNGYNGTFSAEMTLGKFTGVGIDFSYIRSEKMKQDYHHISNKFSAIAPEFLFYLQSDDLKVQPYLAAGVGLYYNRLDSWNGYQLLDSSSIGLAIVGKAGIRFFLRENLFIGVYAKYFTNWQEVRYNTGYYEEDKTLNLGGIVGNIELGYKF